MKQFAFLVLAVFTLQTGPSKAQITDYEAPGNLKANAPLGCVALSDVTNEETPADIYPGVAACIKSGAYQKATLLYAAAGTYGYFDKLRVLDSTAHQAVTAIEMNDFGDLTEVQKQSFMKVASAMLDPSSPSLKSVCSAVERLGPPKYFPTYMIQHGMSAFLDHSGSGIQDNFDTVEGWRKSLSGYLHCP